MAVRVSTAEWKGTLKEGTGTVKLASGAYEGPFTFASRFESGKGTNPEELIGAAHAGRFSMFLSALLSDRRFQAHPHPDIRHRAPRRRTEDHPDRAFHRSGRAQPQRGAVPEAGGGRQEGVPGSVALAGPKITLKAKLLK